MAFAVDPPDREGIAAGTRQSRHGQQRFILDHNAAVLSLELGTASVNPAAGESYQ